MKKQIFNAMSKLKVGRYAIFEFSKYKTAMKILQNINLFEKQSNKKFEVSVHYGRVNVNRVK